MLTKSKSIRTFIGAKDYNLSRQFYRTLGFEETVVGNKMCVFSVNSQLRFYLQDYYVKDWINNSMVFLEVEDIEACYAEIMSKKLPEKFPNVRISSIKHDDWGSEIFMHDPSGILWHFGVFK